MGLRNGTVNLENNYEVWKRMFNSEKEILKDIFKEVALSIEHVGSTAVIGLSAKPIVDIAIGVKNLDDVLRIKNIEPTYNVKVNDNKEEILLIKESDTETFFLIHVLNIDSIRYKNMILFRDILNNNPDIKEEYENLKKELSVKYHDDRKMYTQSKNEFIQKIINKF